MGTDTQRDSLNTHLTQSQIRLYGESHLNLMWLMACQANSVKTVIRRFVWLYLLIHLQPFPASSPNEFFVIKT